MSEQLARSAEKLKLARLLEADPDDLGYLDDVPAVEIRTLRERLTDSFFDGDRRLFGRVAAAARLVPTVVAATIAERAFGPLLCARVAASADPAKAIDIAKRLSPTFLADTTALLDPRRVAAIIAGVPVSLAVPVAEELERRGEHVTMGRFLASLPDELIAAAMGALSDEALLRTAFVLEHKEALDHAVGLMSPEGRLRLASRPAFHRPEILREIVQAGARGGLWLQLVPMLRALPPEVLAELPAVIAELDLELLREMLTQAVSEIDALVPVLDLVGDLDEAGRARVIASIDGADREVGEVLVEELSDPDQIRLLLDHPPADVLAAVERAAAGGPSRITASNCCLRSMALPSVRILVLLLRTPAPSGCRRPRCAPTATD